ncbi:MAG: cytidylate kinase [Spirochaetaceae bacterium]|nr:MAG: cytidylate kinase [Spirochaetaceae bacterium]
MAAIAISGKSGCGNSTVSRLVAERLGLRLVNYTFHTIAEERGLDFDELCRMAEDDPGWDRYLDQRQVEMAREGSCVLGSRLAVWLLRDEADLTVYLTAPLAVRAERIWRREGGSYAVVLERTRLRDERDRYRYLKLYNIDNNHYDFVDLLIDTESQLPEQIADRIVAAAVPAVGRRNGGKNGPET